MSRAPGHLGLILGGAAGLLVLVAAAALLLVDLDHYRPRLEAAASDALGMQVHIAGHLGWGLVPGFHVTLDEGRILGDRAVVVAAAKRIRLWIGVLPLLRGRIQLHRVELTQPSLIVQRDPDGRFNVDRLRKAAALIGQLDGARISIVDGSLRYVDLRTGEGFEATGCTVDVSRLRFVGGDGPHLTRGTSLRAQLACRELRTKDFSVSALTASVDGSNGVLRIEPIAMQVFGGRMTGSLQADISGPLPRYRLRCSLPRFQIAEFLKTLSPKPAAEGAMDFTADLAMQGRTGADLLRSAAGAVSLRGADLTLLGTDLDGSLARFESSQNFNLVDVGAVFFAGPLGLALTRGYGFAGLFHGSGGTSHIRRLVSDWSVERGVARARDVALATERNRIALHGGLDFVDSRFDDVTLAVIDPGGCARMRQAIHGSFAKPTVEKPRLLASVAGPVVRLVQQARRLFPERPCEVFYSGSVVAPG